MNILSECSSAKKPKLENDNCFEKDNFIEESSFLCNIADELLACQIRLIHDLNYLHFTDPVSHVYNPLTYAFEPYSIYVKKYCTTTKHVLFIGMNPGPFGMAQTGVTYSDANIYFVIVNSRVVFFIYLFKTLLFV